MGNKVPFIGLLLLLLLLPSLSTESQGTTSISVDVTNNSSNTNLLDIQLSALEISAGTIQSTGPVYKISTSLQTISINVEWNFTGLLTYPSLLGSEKVMGDTFYAVDGKINRLVSSSVKDGFQLFPIIVDQGVHTLSLIYIGIDSNNVTLYDIESIYIEVRQIGTPFGFSLGEINLSLNLVDTFNGQQPYNSEMIVPGSYTAVEPSREMPDQSSYSNIAYDTASNTLSLSMTYNSSGSLNLQNSTGQMMSQGLLLFSDARGVFAITNTTNSMVVFSGQTSMYGLIVVRHAGFFDNAMTSLKWSDWEELGNVVGAQASFDIVMEQNLLLFSDGNPITYTQTQTNQENPGNFDPRTNSTTTTTTTTPKDSTSSSTHSESDTPTDDQTSSGEAPAITLPIPIAFVIFSLGFVVFIRRYQA